MRQSTLSRSGKRERSWAKVVSALTDFVSRQGSTRRLSSPRGAAREGRTVLSEQPERGRGVERLELADTRQAKGGEPGGPGRTHARQQADRLGRQQGGGLRADDGEAARLVALGSELGEQPVRAEADGDGDADLTLHAPGEPGEHDRRRSAMERLGPRQVERRLVDGERFDERREVAHQRPDAPGFRWRILPCPA